MGYTSLQIGEILLKADRTMYKIGSIAYNNMFAENDETLDYQRDIIYIYKKAVEWGDDYYIGTTKLDKIVERLAAYIAIYDYGTLSPVYSSSVSVITTWIPPGAALNDLTDVTITNVLDKQYLRYDASSQQWVNFGAGTTIRSNQAFTATAGQTTFTTTAPFEANLIDVYLNGVKLNTASYTVFGQHSIILNDAAEAGDIMDVIIYDPVSTIINPPSQAGNAGKFLTTDGFNLSWAANPLGTVTSVDLSAPTGFVVSGNPVTSSGTLALGFAAGYSLPSNATQSDWTTAYNRSLVSASVSGTTTKTLTLNEQDGTAITAIWSDYDTQGVTSVSTNVGTTGTDVNSNVINPTTTPTININVPDASASSRGALTSTDWTTFNNKQAAITLTTTGSSGAATFIGNVLNIPNYGSALSGYVPTSRTLTINGTTYDLTANRTWSVGTVTSVDFSVPTGFAIANNPITTSGTLALTFAAGYSLPTNVKQSNWDDAYTWVAAFPTLTGNTGKFLSNDGSVLNWQTVDLSSRVPTSRQLTINGVTYDLSADRTWTIVAGVSSVAGTAPISAVNASGAVTISISQSSASADGYLSSADWTTFNAKQPAGNYITSLTGEATASGPGAASVTLTNSAVIGKVLTGLNVTGGSISATDSILQAFGKIQNQINGLVGGLQYQGTWNANTNTPTLSSGVGTNGHFYIVSVAGSTNLDGITDWKVGDWAVYHASSWQKVDNTESVTSVNGFTGAVSLTTSNISEGTNLYYTDSRARQSISLTTTGTSGAATYDNTTGVLNIPQYQGGVTSFNTRTGAITLLDTDVTGALGYTPVTNARTLTINGTSYDLSANRTWSVGTVTSVGLTMPAAFTVTNSPVTGSGTLTVAGAGTASQYIDGTGALQTFPTVVDSGALVTEVYNSTGATLTKGTIVYINGGQGNLPTVTKAQANNDANSAQTFGFVRNDITNMNNGYVIVAGKLGDLNTNGLGNGTQLYLSPTTAGQWTTTKPLAPDHLVYVGVVVRDHPTQGVIEVIIQNGYELYELHDVQVGSYGTKDVLYRNTSTNLWKNIDIFTLMGAASGSANGYLTSTDWTTFNNKVPATRSLSINGVSYDLSADRSWTIGPTIYSRGLQKFTATAGQTTFTITNGYTVGLVDVYRNGVKLDNALEFTASNGTTVVLTDAAALNDVIEVYKYGSEYIPNNALRTVSTFTATAAQTTFSVTYSVGLIDVFYNGAKLAAAEYTATNGTSVVLASACVAGDIVEVIAYNYLVNGYSGISGSGNSGYIPKFTSATSIGNSLIYDDGTNVGIGTATPAVKLDVAGRAQFTNNAFNYVLVDSTISDSYLRLASAGTVKWYFRNNISNSHRLEITSDAGTTGMLLTQAGAATFSSNVTANGSAYFGTFNGSNKYYFEPFSNLAGGANNAYLVSGKADNNERSGFVFQARNSNGEEYNVVAFEGYNSTATSTAFAIGSTGAATFSSSVTIQGGNGIYVNNAANTRSGSFLTSADGTEVSSFNGAGEPLFLKAPSSTGSIRFVTNGTNSTGLRMVINESGNVGIGTTSPGTRLHIYDSASGSAITKVTFSCGDGGDIRIGKENGVNNNAIFGTWSNNDVLFYSNSAERMRILSGGNVGIGTSTPDYLFTIDGKTGDASTVTLSRFYASKGQSGAAYLQIQGTRHPTASVRRMILDAYDGGGASVNLILQQSGGNVGIGTVTPNILGVTGTVTTINTQTALAYGGLELSYQGTSIGSFLNNYNASVILSSRTAIPLIFETAATERMRITSGGNVAINNNLAVGRAEEAGVRLSVTSSGTSSAAYSIICRDSSGNDLFVLRNDGWFLTGTRAASPYNNTSASSANLVVFTDGSFGRSTSSLKYKTDVTDYNNGLSKVMQLRPVSYKGKNDGDKIFAGLIAEEVHDLGLTEFVQYAEDGSPDALAYQNMIALLTKAIQELKAEVDSLKNN
jgi:hypothetical protein